MGMTQRQNDTYLFIRDIDAMRYKVQEEKKLRKISSQKFGIKEILSIFAT